MLTWEIMFEFWTGVWFMHCHLDVHTSWGLKMGWIVLDGPQPNQKLQPPPSDLPQCWSLLFQIPKGQGLYNFPFSSPFWVFLNRQHFLLISYFSCYSFVAFIIKNKGETFLFPLNLWCGIYVIDQRWMVGWGNEQQLKCTHPTDLSHLIYIFYFSSCYD